MCVVDSKICVRERESGLCLVASVRGRISEAVEAVKSKALSYRQAGSKYNCSRSSIYDHVHGMSKSSNMGKPNALTKEEEKDIVRCCEVLGRLGVCANRQIVGKVIKDYLAALSRPNPFLCGVPGQRWWREYLKRWPESSERKPEHLTVQRAKAALPSVIYRQLLFKSP